MLPRHFTHQRRHNTGGDKERPDKGTPENQGWYSSWEAIPAAIAHMQRIIHSWSVKQKCCGILVQHQHTLRVRVLCCSGCCQLGIDHVNASLFAKRSPSRMREAEDGTTHERADLYRCRVRRSVHPSRSLRHRHPESVDMQTSSRLRTRERKSDINFKARITFRTKYQEWIVL